MINIDQGLYFVGKIKPNGEKYFFLFDEVHRRAVMREMLRWACRPDLDFDEIDFADLMAEVSKTRGMEWKVMAYQLTASLTQK